ncbi:MAG: hypothetical protein KDA61_04220 [Planctomycetales bacterium]|nr:hypothetical protein [Planctomycetales bacterium]
MRAHWTQMVAAAALAAIASGCGSSASAPETAQAPPTAQPAADHPVARVARDFLTALKQGDTASASNLLTPLAQQNYDFSPPGSPTATFQIGEVEIIAADKAVVDSIWTDRDADGNPTRERIIWALRMAEGKWRISGMAADFSNDLPSVAIDFENPDSTGQSTDGVASTQPSSETGASPPLQADRATQDPFQQPLQR